MPNNSLRLGCLTLVLMLLFVGGAVYYFARIDAADKRAEAAEKQLESIMTVKADDGRKANEQFIHAYFGAEEGESAVARLERVQKLLSEKGKQSLSPSNGPDGEGEPDGATSLQTNVDRLNVYERPVSANEIEFLNEFDLTTMLSGEAHTVRLLVRCSVHLQPEEAGWKVEDVEVIGDLTAANQDEL
ncbi:hypothetical protein B8V81_5091 [Paenibacillus pasadenensis]|uniref:Uncharacterized protein n=1 Tax=Paenibacillus pasadenensis TaxID=217090 RepID=A0A2N5MZP3_9BACL|nr:hypothetical protein [Paenibacillus pasadenensis]PLT43551.1 hypothetical protein B8V81_5091 [Paenibacillus pasadenensis]